MPRPHIRLIRCLSVAGLLLAMQTSVLGQVQQQRAVLDLVVNQVPRGEVLVILRGTDALIPVTALREAGVERFEGSVERAGEVDYVSLSSLAPKVSFTFSERDLRLSIVVAPDMLAEQSRTLSMGEPRGVVHRSDTSGYMNYALNWSEHTGADAFTETALSAKGMLFYNTLTARTDSVVRGLTNITIDRRLSMRRWVFGDTLSHSGLLGGTALLAGVSFSREFSTAPYFVRYPSLSLTTPVTVPSVVEVRVNDRLVSQEQVAPGRLVLENLPLTSGRNDAQITVRDPFGGVSQITSGYYLTTTGLARGLHDYQYSFGVQRRALGVKNWDYTSPALIARHRVGLTDSFTLGGRAEATEDVANGGPTANIRLPFGEIETAAAVSRIPAGIGSAFTLSYMYAGRSMSGGGGATVASDRYENMGEMPDEERSTLEWNLFGSVPLGPRASLSMQHNWAGLRNNSTRIRSSMLTMFRLSRRTDLTLSASRIHDEKGTRRELFAGLTLTFGGITSSVAAIRNDEEGLVSAVEVQRPLPVGVGYGYQFRTTSGPRDTLGGVAQFQGRHGRYEVRREGIDGEYHTTLTASGSLVGIGGGFYASRPVQSSFALVRVPGVEGVRAFSSNQEIGRTDEDGNLLVPDLQPYYANLLAISDADVPLQYTLPDVDMALAPPYRGGAMAVFPVTRENRVAGVVVLATPTVKIVPAYGELRVRFKGREVGSPIGAGGEFFLEQVEPGRHEAVVEFGKTTCSFTLDVPESDSPITKLGKSECRVPENVDVP